MPINFETILAPFRTAFMVQRRTINEMFEKLAKWLTKRLKETQERERATSSMQRFSFTGSAMEIWIDESQHGKLLSAEAAPPAGFWAKVAAPFVSFWKNFTGSIGAMVKSEWVIPDVLSTISKFIQTLLASIDRFKEPTPDLFDLQKGKQFWDIIGELFLFARVISTEATVKQVQRFSSGGIEMLQVLRKQFPPTPPKPGDTSGSQTDITKTLVGATLALPLVARMLTQMAQTASLSIRLAVLDEMSAIQKEVFDLRRDLLNLFYVDVMALGRKMFEWVLETGALTVWGIDFGMRFLKLYWSQIEDWINTLGSELKRFGDELTSFLRILGDYLETFLTVDIGKKKSPGGIVSLTVAELMDRDALLSLRRKLLLTVLSPIIIFAAGGKIKALREVLRILATDTPFPDEAAPPDVAGLAKFPDVYDAFYGAGSPKIADSFKALGETFKSNADTILGGGAGKLLEMGEKFEQAGTAATQMGSAKRYATAVAESERLAKLAFGGDEMRKALQGRSDALAKAFEDWLAASGFKIVAQALPIYVERMIEYWQSEASKKPEERPTSPHILAKRAEVNRVKVPRMVLNVNEERALDKVLAAEVAALFQGAVGEAFRTAVTQYAGSD